MPSGIDVGPPGLLVVERAAEKGSEVERVTIPVGGGQFMHVVEQLLGDFPMKKFCGGSVVGLGNLCVDLVAVVPLFPSQVVQVHQHAFDPSTAGLTRLGLLEVAVLDLLPGFGCRSFKEVEPAYLVLLADGDADFGFTCEGINGSLVAPSSETVHQGLPDGWVGLDLGEVVVEALDAFVEEEVGAVAVTSLDVGCGFHGAGASRASRRW